MRSPADTFGDLGAAAVSVAKTADRSVLGCMNDMANYGGAIICQAGSLAATDLAASRRRFGACVLLAVRGR